MHSYINIYIHIYIIHVIEYEINHLMSQIRPLGRPIWTMMVTVGGHQNSNTYLGSHNCYQLENMFAGSSDIYIYIY